MARATRIAAKLPHPSLPSHELLFCERASGPEHVQDRLLDPIPVPQNVNGGESQSPVSAEDECGVPPAILGEALRGRVELEAVDFDEKTILDEQVHATDARHRHLLTHGKASMLQPLPSEGFHP